jgi:hypothetical protein
MFIIADGLMSLIVQELSKGYYLERISEAFLKDGI